MIDFIKEFLDEAESKSVAPAVPLTSIGAVMKGLRPFHDSPDGLLNGDCPL